MIYSVIIGSILIISLLLFKFTKTYIIAYKLSNWRINDVGLLYKVDPKMIFRACLAHPQNEPMVIILGWSEKDILVSLFNGERWYIKRSNIKNITLEMRKMEKNITSYMTKVIEPQIESQTNGKTNEDNEITYKGKLLKDCNKEELNEVLNLLEEEEDYENMAKVRDILKTK